MSLGFFIYKIMSSANKQLTSFFLIWMIFTSFSCLIALDGTSSTMLNKSCKSGHLSLLLDLKEKAFSFLSFSVVLPVGLSYMVLYYVEVQFFYT